MGFLQRMSCVVALATLLAGRLFANELKGVEEVFDPADALAKASVPTVCVLDTEHPDIVRQKVKEKGVDLYKGRVLKKRAAEISGLPAVLVHYSTLSWKEFANPNIKAIFLMAQFKRMNNELHARLFQFIRDTRVPMIGFCGGHQMIAESFGAKTVPMRDLKPGETDPNPKYHPGRLKEWGFLPVRITKQDPLFEGFNSTFVVKEMHAFHVTSLPPVFEVLAATDTCDIQVIKHKDRVLYGTQSHPEAYDAEHTDGKKLLANFFRAAGIEKKK